MQTAALIQGNQLSLFFHDTLIDPYLIATVSYYETGEYAPYIAFFKQNYELGVSMLAGDYTLTLTASETVEFDRRLALLPSLKNAPGAAHLFWQLAQEALMISDGAQTVNWEDIERQTIIQSIAKYGYSPEAVGTMICQYSPGAYSPQNQLGVLDDIKRLAPILQAQYANSINQSKTSDL
ncbi:hypothetical protein [Orrella sp. 11846]|uniref:hypothetical protein n=1 Tax=Orrella sp. 11846 TaxID=3409913 RepID=UPI003B5A65A5